MASRNTVQIIINAKDDASSVLGGIGGALGKLGKIAAIGAAAVGVATIGMGAAIAKLAVDAAPLQGVQDAFAGLAQSANIGSDKMLAALERGSAGMVTQRDLMTSFNKAAGLVSIDFAQTLPDAMGFLGKVAASTGEDIDFLLNSFVTGIGRLSPMILDNLQIQVDLVEANQAYAESIGVTVDELDKQQQQTALTNQVLEKLAVNTAAMPDIAGSAAAGIAQFGTMLQNAGDQVGLTLAPEMGRFIGLLNKLGQSVLPPIIDLFRTGIAPAFSLFVDKLSSLVGPITETSTQMEVTTRNARRMGVTLTELATTATSTGEKFVSGLVSKLASAAENALRWGVNITTQLATGLIQGAATAITAAMQFIGNMLSSWLAPGSPPMVAPDIGKWGTEAMSEYLRGFTEASFNVLEDIQSPLQSVLSSLVSAGEIGANAARDVFRDLSGELTVALTKFQETGEISVGIFDRLRVAGGAFGDDLAELAKRQFELAAATTEVKAAENALSAAREQEEKAQNDLTSAMGAFNQALAEGASPAILAQKRKEFEAAKQRLATSKEETKEAAKNKKSAEGKIKPLQEQVGLQARLLKQLTQLSVGQEEVAASASAAMAQIAAAAGGAAGISAPSVGAPSFELPEIDTGSLDSVFADAKKSISDKLTDIFQPLVDAWEDLKTPLEDMNIAWDEFKIIVAEAADVIRDKLNSAAEDVAPIVERFELGLSLLNLALQGLWDLVVPIAIAGGVLLIAANIETLAIGALILAGNIGAAAASAWGAVLAFAAVALPIVLLGAALIALGLLWKKYGEQVKTTLGQIGFIILFAIDKAVKTITQGWFVIKFKTFEFLNGIIENWTEIWNAIVFLVTEKVEEIKVSIATKTEEIKVAWKQIWEDIETILGVIWNNIKSGAQTKLQEVFTVVTTKINSIKQWISDQVTFFKQLGLDIIDGLKAGIEEKFAEILAFLSNVAAAMLTEIEEVFGISSRSKAMVAIGENLMDALAFGIAINADVPASTMRDAGGDTITNVTNNFNQTINAQDSDVALESLNSFQDLRSMVRA